MIIKCKMCGGDVQFNLGDTCGQCDHCGTMSTIPRIDEEQKVNRYNRANHFRRLNEFDKAIAAYERILEEDDTDAEAHWGVVLSQFGIEYVEDPVSHRRIPTCHRVQISSILADEDYLAAIQYAPDDQCRSLYEEQAKEIAEIQKRILAISQNEEPYDVFICYKEADDNGNRIKDSTIAQEIYYELTEQGYKVFFSRITLEDKLGQEYEPYIFAALNSASVMVVIGTKPEYFESVWVKNEWSRYLSLVKADRKRLLIPCYKDMDAYELPEELGNLQSQDMNRIGFMQDLIRGIQKNLNARKEDSKANLASVQTMMASGSNNVDALIDRAFISLEDGEFEKADELCEMALNLNPRNANAYMGKLMADLKVPKIELLGDSSVPFDSHPQYKKIMRFGDEQLVTQLQQYNLSIRDRIKRARDAEIETDRIIKKYNETVSAFCLAEAVIMIEEESLRSIEKAIDNTKKEINRFQEELTNTGNIFMGKRRRDLEQCIFQRKDKLNELEKKAEESKSKIDNARMSQISKPDHKMMVYQIANVYYQKQLYSKAAKEFVKILDDFGDVSLLINQDEILKREIDSRIKYREEYTREEKEDAASIYDAAQEEAIIEVKTKKQHKAVAEFGVIGNTVRFGSYVKAQNSVKEPIEWIVTSYSDGFAQLVCKYGIEAHKFHSVASSTLTWEKSDIRRWLNFEFFQMAFSAGEKKSIKQREVINDYYRGNPKWYTDGGATTVDRVYLLSYAEAMSLLSGSQRICYATSYARSNGANVTKDGTGSWWLRSPGNNSHMNSSYIGVDGKIHASLSTISSIMVRPSIWVNLMELAKMID